MSATDTSDALDLTKENIKPLKQGRKPIQLETALQAQSNSEIQQKLNKEKEQHEHAIRTYEGDDPLAPRFQYIKWLEQMYLKHGPESNLLPLLEETVQKFKDDPKYKQDPRFVQILINFIENQPNAVELYQTVYNQGLGTMCALFYRAWADLLDRYNDIKRVDQIYMLGIQSRAEPVEDLEQAHLQFQLSVARRMLNGQLQNEDDKNQDSGKRQAFSVLKKTETKSGIRHGLGGLIGKVPQTNNVNGKASALRVFEDGDDNALLGFDNNSCDLAPKGLNKENTVNPGPWTKPKKSRAKVPKPVSSVNFEVHQDNNIECVTKLPGITVPNALRSIKGSATLSCPVAVFEPPDPTKRPMYCKDKVYAAGRDVQIEEIRYEIYMKQEKERQVAKRQCLSSIIKSPAKVEAVKPVKKVILPEDNLNVNHFKVPLPQRMEPDTLSQSVTVNTRVAIDLVQQMWNSPCTDKVMESETISNDRKPVSFAGFDEDNNCKKISSNFMVYEDAKDNDKFSTCTDKVIKSETTSNVRKPISFAGFEEDNCKKIPSNFMVYEDNKVNDKFDKDQLKKPIQSRSEFSVFTDDDDQAVHFKVPEVYVDGNDENQRKSFKTPEVYVDKINESQKKRSKIPTVYVDKSYENQKKSFNTPDVYVDDENVKLLTKNKGDNVFENKSKTHDDKKSLDKASRKQVYPYEDTMNPIDENKSPFKKIPMTEENDDMTCSTKAFAFLLSSSTPLAQERTKPRSVIGNQLQSLNIKEEEEKESEDFPVGKNLSMILEASKERNSSASSGIISTVTSAIKTEQPSTIDFGDSINPFDDELINKLLKQVIKFPNDRHTLGYVEHDSDVPSLRSEFKLGQNKMTFLSEIGKGSYARVVKARSDGNSAVDKAIKVQKPACVWEWYISKEIQYRLKDSEKVSYFINMDNLHAYRNGSIILMDFANHGTLLSVILAFKHATNRSLPIPIAALFASQITSAVKYLHQCQIIHGDLKPDNVIVKSLPNQSLLPCVQLIDFGRSIDMTLFPSGTSFTYSVKTADFVCHEMRDKLPWTYQTDYYGLAGIIYLLLMSDYMKTQKIRKVWVLIKPLPRYIDKDLWGSTLNTLLNIESCKKLPNLDEIIDKLNQYVSTQQKVVFSHSLASLKNALKK